jgi:ribosomal protein L7/L12
LPCPQPHRQRLHQRPRRRLQQRFALPHTPSYFNLHISQEKPKEKTIFNVKLESFDAAAKAKIIKEVKSLVPNLTLIEAKKFVESLPKVLKENMSKEDAEKLKATFTGLGGVVVLE